MTTPALPLDALVGYTVTRVGHVYTLTPATKGPAPMQANPLGIHCRDCSVEAPCAPCALQIRAEADYVEEQPDSDLFATRAEWREPVQ